MLPVILLIIFLLVVLLGPQYWAQSILKKYAVSRPDIPGNGAEFARHLIEQMKLSFVTVEQSEQGDHYDPVSCKVRLSADNMQHHSLTAVVVAAHEVGHAIQHAVNYRAFHWRNKLVGVAQHAEKLGAGLMLVIPVVGLISRSPAASGITLLLAVLTMLSAVLVHLVTLPVEWNASFSRALPILEKGQYLDRNDMRAARKILLACALTYLAQSLMSLINFWRWIRLLRR